MRERVYIAPVVPSANPPCQSMLDTFGFHSAQVDMSDQIRHTLSSEALVSTDVPYSRAIGSPPSLPQSGGITGPDTLLPMGMQQTRSRRVSTASTVLVAVAAAMWATDAYWRPGLTKQLSAGQIVLVEDLLISICLVPILLMNIGPLRRLTGRRWLALIAIGVGPQAVATVLFTKAIGYAFPSHAPPQVDVLHAVYLLYLLQPVFC